jgi:hypothetical protein
MLRSELRVGNLLDYNGKTIIVDTIYYDQINLDFTDFSGIKFEALKGIPISEEWLLKFGFARFPWGLVKEELLFRDNIQTPCKELTLEVGNGFRVTVQYIHQLQNLYFALTGKELI